MYRSIVRCASMREWWSRAKGFIRPGGEIPPLVPPVATQGEQTRGQEEYEEDIDTSAREQLDAIRARGVMKFRNKYEPPVDLENQISSCVRDLVKTEDDWRQISLEENPVLKFKLLTILESRLSHPVPNSRLHELKYVSDVVGFYSEPVSNLNTFTQLARSDTKPPNVHINELPERFQPDDTDAWHRGITAFPGEGAKSFHPRSKRLYRSFNAKKEWFDWRDTGFDYSRPPEDSPWDPDTADQLDTIRRRRHKF